MTQSPPQSTTSQQNASTAFSSVGTSGPQPTPISSALLRPAGVNSPTLPSNPSPASSLPPPPQSKAAGGSRLPPRPSFLPSKPTASLDLYGSSKRISIRSPSPAEYSSVLRPADERSRRRDSLDLASPPHRRTESDSYRPRSRSRSRARRSRSPSRHRKSRRSGRRRRDDSWDQVWRRDRSISRDRPISDREHKSARGRKRDRAYSRSPSSQESDSDRPRKHRRRERSVDSDKERRRSSSTRGPPLPDQRSAFSAEKQEARPASSSQSLLDRIGSHATSPTPVVVTEPVTARNPSGIPLGPRRPNISNVNPRLHSTATGPSAAEFSTSSQPAPSSGAAAAQLQSNESEAPRKQSSPEPTSVAQSKRNKSPAKPETPSIPEGHDMTRAGNGGSGRWTRGRSAVTSTNALPLGGGGGGRATGSGSNGYRSNRNEIPGPMRTKQYILEEYERKNVRIKDIWVENPKSPLANYFQESTSKAPRYETEMGWCDGQQICRASIIVDAARGIIGVGDDRVAKEAEKLAALDAVLQLTEKGALGRSAALPKGATSGNGFGGGGQSSAKVEAMAASSGEKANLSDGTAITYNKARLFMEFYCAKFQFNKPDVSYEQSSLGGQARHRKGGGQQSKWDAIMTVGGRRIGMGSGKAKKDALIKCYLDVVVYLESCDHSLWTEYIAKGGETNYTMAPHLGFDLSDALSNDMRDIAEDARHTSIFRNAPESSGSAGAAEVEANRYQPVGEGYLRQKADAMSSTLRRYNDDSRLASMRSSRQALPIAAYKDEIVRTIEASQVTVLVAQTGSGKSTQAVQYVLDSYIEAGQGSRANIFVTQPRRLAATSVAERVASERGQNLGQEVGYQVRFDAKLPQSHGSITFVTVGIFLKRLQSALGHPNSRTWLDDTTHIFIDEVHERDMDTDLLLCVLKSLQQQRPKLKIVLMSATVNADLFSQYFIDERGRPAPIMSIPGRLYSVDRTYMDDLLPQVQRQSHSYWVFQDKMVAKFLETEMSSYPANISMDAAVPLPLVALMIAYVLERLATDDGDILVFIPGLEEMKKCQGYLLNETGRTPVFASRPPPFEVMFLHSSIPAAEQRLAFQPSSVRRVFLATNIAEASITLNGVTSVIDTCSVKRKEFDAKRLMSSLVTGFCGVSNLDQRAGRAGRVREGSYYGLISKARLASLKQHSIVEMQRLDLSEVVMHVKALNLGNVEDILARTIEPPTQDRVLLAIMSLGQLGALNPRTRELTALGKLLLNMPLDARLGKMCLYGVLFKSLTSAITLACILAERDAFLSPMAEKARADAIKENFAARSTGYRSDALAVLNAFNEWVPMQEAGHYREANQYLQENFLHKSTFLSIMKSRVQVFDGLRSAGVLGQRFFPRRGPEMLTVPADLDVNSESLPVKAALIAIGSQPNFAIRISEKNCMTHKHKSVSIHPSSVNARRREEGGVVGQDGVHRGEKRLYAYSEAVFIPNPGSKADSGAVQLRGVTRLDPLTYLLFAAFDLRAVSQGLLSDEWIPVVGDLDILDDVQRLKNAMDKSLLRVFEGMNHHHAAPRTAHVMPAANTLVSRAATPDEREHESSDEDDAEGPSRPADKPKPKRKLEPLSPVEIDEMHTLASNIVRLLDRYALERDPALSRAATRPSSPAGFRSHTRPSSPAMMVSSNLRPDAPSDGMYRPPHHYW